MAVQMYRLCRVSKTHFLGKPTICTSVVGVLGFFEAAWIDLFSPELLGRFELPNDPLAAVRLTTPDGRVFIVNSPIARVQRYGPEGLEKGFMYGHKAFKFGMSASGNILIYAVAGVLLTYSSDGAELPPRGSCRDRFEVSSSFYRSHAKSPTIAFNWFSALAVPLWHPVAGWVIIVLGVLLFKLSSPPRSDTP